MTKVLILSANNFVNLSYCSIYAKKYSYTCLSQESQGLAVHLIHIDKAHIQDSVNFLLSDYQTISMASISSLQWIGAEYIPSGQCNEDKCSFEYKVMICMISMLKVNIQMFINNHLHNPL